MSKLVKFLIAFRASDADVGIEVEGMYRDGEVVPQDRDTATRALFAQYMGTYTEVEQPQMTHREGQARGPITGMDRLDRGYLDLPAAEILDLHPVATALWTIGQHREVSDHVPVAFSFGGRDDAAGA